MVFIKHLSVCYNLLKNEKLITRVFQPCLHHLAPVLVTKKDVSFSWFPGYHCDIVLLIFKITFWLNARHLTIVIKYFKASKQVNIKTHEGQYTTWQHVGYSV